MQEELRFARGEERSKGGAFENAFSAEIGSDLNWKICVVLSRVTTLNLEHRTGL